MSAPAPLRALLHSAPVRLAATTLIGGLAAGAATGLVAVALPAAQADAATAGRTFYVSPSGSDANTGTDAAHPFQTLGNVSNGFLQAGDTVLLQGGATFSDKLGVWSSGTAGAPITVGRYGSGKPTLTGGCLDLGGDYLTATKLRVTGCSDDSGIYVYGAHDSVTSSVVTHNIQGIVVDMHAEDTAILHNKVHDNDRMAPDRPGPTDDYGAVGISVGGIDTDVAYNVIKRNVAASPDFGEDGSAVEIYGGINSDVHDNLSVDNSTFTELGNARTAHSTFTNNRVYSSLDYSQFLVTRGSSDLFGPVAGTVATHNTVQLTGSRSLGYDCYAGCTAAMFNLSDNVLDVAGQIGHLDGTMSGGGNTYWGGGTATVSMLPGDRVANPGPIAITGPATVRHGADHTAGDHAGRGASHHTKGRGKGGHHGWHHGRGKHLHG